jgi:hypothetical protein
MKNTVQMYHNYLTRFPFLKLIIDNEEDSITLWSKNLEKGIYIDAGWSKTNYFSFYIQIGQDQYMGEQEQEFLNWMEQYFK